MKNSCCLARTLSVEFKRDSSSKYLRWVYVFKESVIASADAKYSAYYLDGASVVREVYNHDAEPREAFHDR